MVQIRIGQTLVSLAGMLLCTSLCLGQGISNGGFEFDTDGGDDDATGSLDNWFSGGGVTVGAPGDTGSPAGRNNGAQLGPSAGQAIGGGKRWSDIAQDFNCAGTAGTCYIKFSYRLNPAAGEGAYVEVDGPAGRKATALGMAAGFVTVQVVYPRCGPLRIIFGIVGGGASITSDFRVDNVVDKCDSSQWAGAGTPLPLQDVAGTTAGLDMFHTDPPSLGGDSFLKFEGGNVLPANFFGSNSDVVTGKTVYWYGEPLYGAYGNADTVVERITDGVFRDPSNGLCGCGATCQATVRTIIRALNLRSVEPLIVTFNGGATSSAYEVRATLSETTSQSEGTMTMAQLCPEGGTFTSLLPVKARLAFTKLAGAAGNQTVALDPAPVVNLAVPFGGSGPGYWSTTDAGLGASPADSDFYAGIQWSSCNGGGDCNPGVRNPTKVMTPEEEQLAKHGVKVENRSKIHIPAISEWGVAVLALLVLILGTLLLRCTRPQPS